MKQKKSETPVYFMVHDAGKFAREEKKILKAEKIRKLQHLQPLLRLLDGTAGRTIVSISRGRQ